MAPVQGPTRLRLRMPRPSLKLFPLGFLGPAVPNHPLSTKAHSLQIPPHPAPFIPAMLAGPG